MQSQFTRNTCCAAAAFAAVSTFAFTGLMLDRSLALIYASTHHVAAVEVRELPATAVSVASNIPPTLDLIDGRLVSRRHVPC